MKRRAKHGFMPTPEQRDRAISKVRYEIGMFKVGLPLLGSRLRVDGLDHPTRQFLGNAIVESTLLHARLLYDFFATPASSRQKDDILAVDFGFGPMRDLASQQLIMRLHKHLAHLSYERTAKKYQWQGRDFQRILDWCESFVVQMDGTQ